jgi:hypothetical protein
MQTIADLTCPVKPARRQPYTWQDVQDAAAMFAADEENRHLEEMAEQARWDDQFNDTLPGPGHCLQCGDFADLTAGGLCEACDLAATEMSAGMRPAFDRLV